MTEAQGLTTKVMRGGALIYGRILFKGAFNLAVMAILARQLTPAEFGLYALAAVIIRLLVILGEDGINQFIIYDNKEGKEERVHAAFWLDFFLSTAVTLIAMALIPIVPLIYANEGLVPILAVLIIKYPIDSLNQVPDALLKKNLLFKSLALREILLDSLSGTCSVIMALTGYGIWSLVVPSIVISPLRFIIGAWQAKWFPRMHFYFGMWKGIIKYSSNILGATITTFILNEGDTFLVGKLLGSYTLGIYNIAWQTANMVNRNISSVASYIALPAFSSLGEDYERMKSGWNRMALLLSTVTFPILIGMFVVADDFIFTVYGPQWESVILPLRIFIIYALRHSVSSPASAIFKAVGRPDYGLKLGLSIAPFYLASIWVGSIYNVVGVATGVTVVRTLFGWIGFVLVARCLKTTTWKIVQPLLPALLASCIMGLIVFVVKMLLGPSLPSTSYRPAVLLFIEAVVGGIAYLMLLRSVFRGQARELVQGIQPVLGKYGGHAATLLNVDNYRAT